MTPALFSSGRAVPLTSRPGSRWRNHNSYFLTLLFLAGCGGGSGGGGDSGGGGSEPPPPPADDGCLDWSGGRMIATALADELQDVVISPQGQVYVAGYENGTLGVATVDPSGAARGIVLRYTADGLLARKDIVYADTATTVESIALDAEGNALYLAGRTRGALPGYINSGQFDLIAGRLALDTNDQLLDQFPTGRPQHPRRLLSDSAGGWIVAGFDDVYVPTNFVEAWENPLLVNLSYAGPHLVESWRVVFDSSYTDIFGGLAVTEGGASFVTGHSEGGNERGVYVAKYSAEGLLLWQSQQTASPHDNGAALEVVADGGLIFAGSTSLPLGGESFGQLDAVVRNLDETSGEPVWTRQYGSSEIEWVTDMAIDTQGQIYVVGETWGIVEPGKNTPVQGGFFLLKLSATGELLLAKQWDSPAFETPTAVAVNACEQVVIVGYTNGDLFGTNMGSRDGFLLVEDTRP